MHFEPLVFGPVSRFSFLFYAASFRFASSLPDSLFTLHHPLLRGLVALLVFRLLFLEAVGSRPGSRCSLALTPPYTLSLLRP